MVLPIFLIEDGQLHWTVRIGHRGVEFRGVLTGRPPLV